MGQGAFTIQTHARGALPPTLTARAKGSDSHAAPLQPHTVSSSLRAALMKRGGGAHNRTRRLSEQFARQGSSLLRVSFGELSQPARSVWPFTGYRCIGAGPKGRRQHPHDQFVTTINSHPARLLSAAAVRPVSQQ